MQLTISNAFQAALEKYENSDNDVKIPGDGHLAPHAQLAEADAHLLQGRHLLHHHETGGHLDRITTTKK